MRTIIHCRLEAKNNFKHKNFGTKLLETPTEIHSIGNSIFNFYFIVDYLSHLIIFNWKTIIGGDSRR